MVLRLLKWKRPLLEIGAGVLLCASLGCSGTNRTQAPPRTMGPGNTAMSQPMSPPLSPAYNNLAGKNPTQYNQAMGNPNPANASPSMGNPNDFSSQGSPNRATQGFIGQPFNPMGAPAVFSPAPQQQPAPQMVYSNSPPLMPSNYGQPGFAPNGYPMNQQGQMVQGMQMPPQQMQMMPVQQPVQMMQPQQPVYYGQPQQYQMQPGMTNVPMSGVTVPGSLPTSLKDMRLEGPPILPTSGIQVPQSLPVEPPAVKVYELPKKPSVTPVSHTPESSPTEIVAPPSEPAPVIPAPITLIK